MPQDAETINLGGVNCFLIKARDGFVLIDTGFATRRDQLERRLEVAGCRPGDLKLIVLTHGDVDHTGNCAYLRAKCGAQIAMHRGDVGMVERGDASWNRKAKPDRISFLFRAVIFFTGLFVRPGAYEVFSPDVFLEDGDDLSTYGCDAVVLHLPGHSKGSIGILMPGGDPAGDRSRASCPAKRPEPVRSGFVHRLVHRRQYPGDHPAARPAQAARQVGEPTCGIASCRGQRGVRRADPRSTRRIPGENRA